MYKGFLEKMYQESLIGDIYLVHEFQQMSGIGKLIFDQELFQELDLFVKIKISIENQEQIKRFVNLFVIQMLLPPFIIDQIFQVAELDNQKIIEEQNNNQEIDSRNNSSNSHQQIQQSYPFSYYKSQLQLRSDEQQKIISQNYVQEVNQPNIEKDENLDQLQIKQQLIQMETPKSFTQQQQEISKTFDQFQQKIISNNLQQSEQLQKNIITFETLKSNFTKNTILQESIEAKLIVKPNIDKDTLSTSTSYFMIFKDQTTSCQLSFYKNILKDKFIEFYQCLTLQTWYTINNVEINKRKNDIEIKILSQTTFNIIQTVPLLQQIHEALNSITFKGIYEEIYVAAIVAQVGEENQQNKRILLYIPDSSECDNSQYISIPLILWDQFKQLDFTIGDLIILEGVHLKIYGDIKELKAVKQKFCIHYEDQEQFKDIFDKLRENRKIWMADKFGQKIIEPIQVQVQSILYNSIHEKIDQTFNTVVKVLKEYPPVYNMQNQSYQKEILVTGDNEQIQKIILNGDRLCSKIIIHKDDIIKITDLVFKDDKVVSDNENTQISILNQDNEEYQIQIQILKQQFSKPNLLSQNDFDEEIIVEGQKVQNKQESSNKKVISIKIPTKSKIENKIEEEIIRDKKQSNTNVLQKLNIKKGLQNQDVFPQVITLAEGKQLKNRFNTIVIIQDLYEIKYQKGNHKIQDLRISDETMTGKITFWNQQINDYKKGQTIQIDGIYFDEQKQEFKTTIHTKININVPQQQNTKHHLSSIQQQSIKIEGVEIQAFPYNSEIILIKDLIQLSFSDEKLQNQQFYCRGTIMDITGKLYLRCSECQYSKVQKIQVDNEKIQYECSSEKLTHIIPNPKVICYLKSKISDFTCSIEVYFHEEIVEQFVKQQTLQEIEKNDMLINPHFNCLLYKEFIMKITMPKEKNMKQNEQRKISVVRLFQVNYLKTIDQLCK